MDADRGGRRSRDSTSGSGRLCTVGWAVLRGSMASAEGDDGGPRVNPHDAGDGTEAPARPDPTGSTPALGATTQEPPLVPASGAPVGTTADPLPMISPTSGAPIIRAVARRPPTPLPALGGTDAPSDVPHSARVTADRRRQAAA